MRAGKRHAFNASAGGWLFGVYGDHLYRYVTADAFGFFYGDLKRASAFDCGPLDGVSDHIVPSRYRTWTTRDFACRYVTPVAHAIRVSWRRGRRCTGLPLAPACEFCDGETRLEETWRAMFDDVDADRDRLAAFIERSEPSRDSHSGDRSRARADRNT